MSDSEVIGVLLVIRHGDRLEFYQDPYTYTAAQTEITPLGNQQEYQLGGQLRSLYLNESSPSYIQGMSTGLFNASQVDISADTGGEGGVIFDSCLSVTQGLWPATVSNNITLANGTTIVAPLGGYQYIQINAVDPGLDISLEGYEDCNTFNTQTDVFYNSTEFQQMAVQAAPFLDQLGPYVGDRPTNLENMWNIFDFMNVQDIHNETFADMLPETFLPQAQALANWHEYNVFSSPDIGGIGNIAGQAMLSPILKAFANIVDPSNPVKLVYAAVSYKPFISLFSMTGVASANPELAGIVNYAAAAAFEVRQPSDGSEPVLRFNFKNGTGADFITYNWMNTTGDIPLSTFIDAMAPYAVNTTADWCKVCDVTNERGCGQLTLTYNEGYSAASPKISPVGAGFLGAGLTVAVIGALFAAALYFKIFSIKPFWKGKANKTSKSVNGASSDGSESSQRGVKV